MMGSLSYLLAVAVEETPPEHHHWMWRVMEHYGLFAVVALLFGCGLGIPVPEDIPLIFVGVMIGRGVMHLPIAGPAAWLAILAGDCVLYSLSFWMGPRVTELPVIGSHLNKSRLKSVEHWFDKYGVWAVGVGRMFAGVRGAMVVVAGATRFNFAKFIVADGIAAIFSGGAFIYIGYLSYRIGARNAEHFRTIFAFVCIGVAIIATAYFIIRARHKSKGELAVDAANLPSPESSIPPSDTTPS